VCIFSQKPGLQASNIEPVNNDHNLKNSSINYFFLMPMFLLGNFSKTPGCQKLVWPQPPFLCGLKRPVKASYGFQAQRQWELLNIFGEKKTYENNNKKYFVFLIVYTYVLNLQ
jgi:hypothetical protein